jgi:hypothetical protein
MVQGDTVMLLTALGRVRDAQSRSRSRRSRLAMCIGALASQSSCGPGYNPGANPESGNAIGQSVRVSSDPATYHLDVKPMIVPPPGVPLAAQPQGAQSNTQNPVTGGSDGLEAPPSCEGVVGGAVERSRCATSPASSPAGKGTLFKRLNRQSAELAPEDICFLPAGRHVLSSRPEIDRAPGSSSYRVSISTVESGCPFSTGFVPDEHVAGTGGIWMRPAPVDIKITSDHGVTRSCAPACTSPHRGIDYDFGTGDLTIAARDGNISHSGWTSGGGHTVAIEHVVNGQPVVSRYLHHSSLATRDAQVSAGQVIGRSGCTGTCFGDHLHFDLRRGSGLGSDDLNPHDYSTVFR